MGSIKYRKRGGKTRRYRSRGGSGSLARSVKPGYPWTANPSTWPGAPASVAPSACGITASNHYPVSKWGIPGGRVGGNFSPNDPSVSTRNFIGGRRRRRGGKRSRRRRQKGVKRVIVS